MTAQHATLEVVYREIGAKTSFPEFVDALLRVSCDVFDAKVTAFVDAVSANTWRYELDDAVRIDQPMRVAPGVVRYGQGDDLNAPFFDGSRAYALAALGAGPQRYGWLYVHDTAPFDLPRRERFESFALFAGAVLKNIRLLEAAQRAAVTDALTDLPNRRAIEEYIFARVYEREAVTYVLVDVNDFKRINDTFGHDKGDEALQAVADALRVAKRREDFVGRLGGDEFVAICNGDGARPLIDRARAALAECGISISAGFAKYPEQGASAKALYTAADEQMYQDKQAHKAARRR